MVLSKICFILIVGIFTLFSTEAYGKRISCCIEPSSTKDGEHGVPGYFEDGENGKNGESGKEGQDGGYGGIGGSSVYGNGGNGGNGGVAD